MLEEKYLSANKQELDSKQVLVECVLSLEQGQIEKVLALSADGAINSVETFEKETKFGGDIYTHLIYLTPQGEMGSVSTTCVFADSIKHDLIAEEEKVKANFHVVSVSPSSIGDNSFKVLVTVEVTLSVEGNNQTQAFKNLNNNNCILEGQLPLQVLTQDVSGNFVCEKSVSIKEGVKNVLVVDSSAILREVTAGIGYVSIQGDVYTYLVYAKKDGGFGVNQVAHSFKEELEVDDCNKDSLLEAAILVKKAETTATIDEKEDGTDILISTPLKAFIKVFENQIFTSVNDIYSLTNELEITKSTIKNTMILPSKYFEAKVEGNLTLTEKEARIDKVLAVGAPRFVLSNYYVNQGEVVVEGVVVANIIYLNDEENTIHSVEIEVPFSTSEKINTELTDISTKVQVALADCDVITKKGREIFFDCKVKIYANLWHIQTKEVISQVVEGRAFAEKDSAIEIYFAKNGDTVWDIAKELKVTEELIIGQNPTLTNPLTADEKVVLYYGIE